MMPLAFLGTSTLVLGAAEHKTVLDKKNQNQKKYFIYFYIIIHFNQILNPNCYSSGSAFV
ncbi:MAG: hypothetical protein MZV64_25025 [Ignavibacteriales bacterium]|nr:hypothetical protein [Ignavibacteriales bacterium]